MKYFPKKIYDRYILFHTGKVYSLYSKKFLVPTIRSKQHKYLRLCFRFNKKNITKQVHRLIAENFIPNPENKPKVDHINRKKEDNRIINLKWATSSENNYNRTQKGYTKFFCNTEKRFKVIYKTKKRKKKSKSFKTEAEADKYIGDNYPFPLTLE